MDTTTSNLTQMLLGANNSEVKAQFQCRSETPTAEQLLHDIGGWPAGLLAVLTFCLVASLAVYAEEIVFLVRNFERGPRLNRTIWILAFFPGFVVTSFVAVLVPRSGTLCDLVSNAFFVTCLYQFLGLIEDYLGGEREMWTVIGESRQMTLSTPPCCCCCPCLPKPILNRHSYLRLSLLVGQVTIVRTILAFIAAVLWVNGSYIPGNLLPNGAFLYIATMNLISTLLSMWGLMILKATTRADLEARFALNGKFGCVQLSLITIALINIIIGILVTTRVIQCTTFFPSKSRSEEITHCILVMVMFLYGLLARHFFRRQADSRGFSSEEDGKTFATIVDDKANTEKNQKYRPNTQESSS